MKQLTAQSRIRLQLYKKQAVLYPPGSINIFWNNCVSFVLAFFAKMFSYANIDLSPLNNLEKLSAWCLGAVGVLWLFFTMPCVGLQCAIVVFPGHTHLIST